MKKKPYVKIFKDEDRAMDWMRTRNRACKLAGNFRDRFVVTDGPENDFAVIDIKSAIELGGGYKWEA